MLEKDPKSVEIIVGKSGKQSISTVKLRINRYSTCTDRIINIICRSACVKLFYNDGNNIPWFLQ